MSLLLSGTLAALLLTSTPALAQGGGAAPSLPTAVPSSTTAGPSLMTAAASLKLAKNYTAPSFMADWDWFTDNDPTGGYVNYVSLADAQSMGLTGQLGDGSFVMRADAETRAAGRGRNSVRISSKAQFRDGVYILDVNHMPVGCGTVRRYRNASGDQADATSGPRGGPRRKRAGLAAARLTLSRVPMPCLPSTARPTTSRSARASPTPRSPRLRGTSRPCTPRTAACSTRGRT